MATSKVFSLAAFVEYGNKCINNANNATPVMQDAFKKDLKKAIAHAGYPSKDEIGVVDEINDFELTNTLAQVPTLVSSFMRDEQRSFDLPAVDPNTCPASIKVVAVEEKTKTGTIKIGDTKGQEYSSTVAAHEEISVKNRRDAFKK